MPHTRTEPDFDSIADLAETGWVHVTDRVGCFHTKKLINPPRARETFLREDAKQGLTVDVKV